MAQLLTFLTAFFVLPACLFSQKVGYQIKAKIDGFDGKEAYLGYYFGDKQYLKDTAYIEADGRFYFEGFEPLEPGVYLIVMPPDNQFIQMVVNKDEQWFTIDTKAPDFAGNMKTEGSQDNKRFYEYMDFLSKKRPEADELNKQMQRDSADAKKMAKLREKMDALDQSVKDYQAGIVSKYPKSLTAAIIKANQAIDIPTFTGTKEETERQSFYWLREHWFDNIDMTDPGMLRTPFLFQKIDHYVNKMTVQHPDSLNIAIDRVLQMVKPAEETFKFYLIHFLNEFAKSKIVGMDAVYVHIVKKYYATGQAPWTEEEQLKKILDNADKLEPLLIGKIAPDIEMETQDGKKMRLHQFQSPITVLFFWDPDCGHCKKSMPEMVKFAKDYKDKGVAVFAICTALVSREEDGSFSMKEVDKCWSSIQEREMDVFFNSVDPYHRSRYKTIYDIRTTPQIYVLDGDKSILSKRIGAEQLPDVLDHILKVKGDKR